jgi:hypothetical protein
LSNDLLKVLLKKKGRFGLQLYLEKEEFVILSCFLASYFEDIVSETNIWKTFISLNKEKYGKFLPFYNLVEYTEGNINHQDISFLIWYFISTINKDLLLSPEQTLINEKVHTITKIFNNAFKKAPINKYLRTFYKIDENEDNYQKARLLIDNIILQSYLFYPDAKIHFDKIVSNYLEKKKDKDDFFSSEESIANFLNQERDDLINTYHTKLLSLKGKEWAAELIGKEHKLYESFINISAKISGYFLYKGQDEKNIIIEHISTGEIFNLTKKSITFADELIDNDGLLYLGIVKWQDEWWFSGIYFNVPYNSEIVENDRKNVKGNSLFRKLYDYEEQDKDMLDIMFSAFLEFNNGSQAVFLTPKETIEFYNDYIKYYNDKLAKEIPNDKKEIAELKYKDLENKNINHNISIDEFDSGLVFFNPKIGIELVYDINSAFPLPENKFYYEEEEEDDLVKLFFIRRYIKRTCNVLFR